METEINENVGSVRMMDGMDMSKPDTADLIQIAECFARMGCEVVILHPVHFKSPEYAAIYGPIIRTAMLNQVDLFKLVHQLNADEEEAVSLVQIRRTQQRALEIFCGILSLSSVLAQA